MPRQIDEPHLFDAVTDLFVSEGYTGMTTKVIAARAGVNEVTLFRRYGGKADLVCAALRARLERVPLGSLVAADDLEADLVRVVEAYWETYRQVGAVIPLLLVEATRHPELRPALEVAWTNIHAVARIVAHHQARGRLRQESPFLAVLALVGPMFVVGLARQAWPELPLQTDAEAHVRGFLQGRAGEDSPRAAQAGAP